jgi:hypothetical protein
MMLYAETLKDRRPRRETFRQILGLKIAKKITISSVRIRKINVETLWRSRPPAKRQKRLPTTEDPRM